MYIHEEKIGSKAAEVIEFNSLSEFYTYICDTPINEVFRWEKHSSVIGREDFTKTKSFEEATDLLKNGWSDMSEILTQKLKVIQNEVVSNVKVKTIYDSAGFQCSVPRYLQGIPTSMINKKNIPIKQKVITVNKSINYNGGVSTEDMMRESIKALQIVKKLEAQGLRVNLNIVLGTFGDTGIFAKVRIKNANERLNISKIAFPLVHPSMLRRLFFRFIEVYPNVTKSHKYGYGNPGTSEQIKSITNGEYLLPTFIKKDINGINDLTDLDRIF